MIYTEKAPSGVTVESEVPFKRTLMHDWPVLIIFWSEWQWVKKIVRAYGFTPSWTKSNPVRRHETTDKDGYTRR